MSKLLFVFCLFAIVIFAVFAESNMENSKTLDSFRGSRVKRGWFCWDAMVGSCCQNSCKGDGCFGFMCDACC